MTALAESLIPSAHAENGAPAAQPQAPGIASFVPLILIFVVFYFLMIRPQQKRAKEHKAMVSNLAKDDEVATSGGLIGRVVDLNEQFVTLEIAEGTRVMMQRHAVGGLVLKGTLKGMLKG